MAGTVCIVQIVNECKPEWNVNIVAVGCKFFFSDGTDFQDGPIQVNVSAGGDTSLRTNDPTKCVIKVFITITAQQSGQSPQNYAGQKDPPPGQCLYEFQARFGAVASLTNQSALEDKNVESSVKLPQLSINTEVERTTPSEGSLKSKLKASKQAMRLLPDRLTREADDHSYDVYIINTSNWSIYSIISENGQEIPINPPIGRTCPPGMSYDNCKNNGNYQRLTTSNCAAAPYRFKIKAVHPTGAHGQTDWQTIQPDCRYPGEVSQFDEPDPPPPHLN